MYYHESYNLRPFHVGVFFLVLVFLFVSFLFVSFLFFFEITETSHLKLLANAMCFFFCFVCVFLHLIGRSAGAQRERRRGTEQREPRPALGHARQGRPLRVQRGQQSRRVDEPAAAPSARQM